MLLFTSLTAFAQKIDIEGIIIDETDEPLIGATVIVKNTDNGAATDIDGRFQIRNVAINDTLVISYVGYITKEHIVQNAGVQNIRLSSDAQLLEEFVVIGYGRQEKKVSTGAISKIEAKDIEGFKVQDVSTALEGQVTGLVVNESSGQPGASKTLLIRGVSTNGDNSPLYIVDGLQVFNLDNIAPGDIESVDVLKDAASTAIYGARAANGVVIVTTKKGKKEGSGNITYDGFTSISNPWRLPKMLDTDDYITLTREKFANSNQLASLDALGFPQAGTEGLPNTDWMDVIFEPALIQNHRISATTKNAFLSLEYWDQNGVIGGEKSNYKRYSARVNSEKEINKYIKVGENIFFNRTENSNIGVNNAFGSVISDAFAYDPITGVYNEDKQYGFEQSRWVQKEYINPLSRLFLANGNGHADQVKGNVYLEISPIEGLTFRSDAGLELGWFNFRSFTPAYEFHPSFINVQNGVSQGYGINQSVQLENYFNYNKSFKNIHNTDFVLGTSYRGYTGESAGGSSNNIPEAVQFDDNWQYVNAGADTTELSYGTGDVKYRLLSYFGRVRYDFKKKYLFTATLRRDGSSNFGENNRWGIFPSFSAGWVVSKEPFFPENNVLDFLKVKVSWGRNGNDRIPALSYAATIQNVFTYPFGQDQALNYGSALATPPNPDVKWEESEQIDIGVEMEFFDGKVNFEADFYRKTTKDLLMQEIIPGYIGATNNPTSNLGEIRNQGIELALGHRLRAGDFTLNTNLTYTHFKNKVIKVAGESGFIQGWSWPVRNTPITRMTEDFPVGHFVGYVTDGIFQSQGEVFSHINSNGIPLQPNAQPGDIRFVDTNNDGEINSDDITDIGSPWPKHIIGLSLNAGFKGIDLSAIFAAQIGHQIYRTYERSDITFTNYQDFWLDSWSPLNPSDEYPRLVSNDVNNNQRPSDFYLSDGSFLRLRNLQVGYSLPKSIISKIKMQGLRIYFTANNLLTITGYEGFDPDIGTNGWILDTGIDKGFYPNNKSFGGGLTITF